MKRRSSSAIFLVSLLLYLQGHEARGERLYANTTSDLIPYQDKPLRLEHSTTLTVICPDRAYGLYRVSLEGYNNCSNDGQQLIGHCANTGEVFQFIYPYILPGSLVWEIDTTYYLIFKYTDSGSTAPCDEGFKFKVFVYNSTAMTPTSTVMPMSSSSYSSSSVVISSSSSSILSQLLTPSFSQSRIHTVSPSTTETTTRPTREQSSSSSSAEIKTSEVKASSTRPTYMTPTIDPTPGLFSGATSTTASLTLALSLLALLLMLLL